MADKAISQRFFFQHVHLILSFLKMHPLPKTFFILAKQILLADANF